MQQEQVSITVTKAKLATVADCVDLLEWARTIPGMAIAVSSRSDGQVVVQAEGEKIDTVYAKLGETITWDGTRFEVTP